MIRKSEIEERLKKIIKDIEAGRSSHLVISEIAEILIQMNKDNVVYMLKYLKGGKNEI